MFERTGYQKVGVKESSIPGQVQSFPWSVLCCGIKAIQASPVIALERGLVNSRQACESRVGTAKCSAHALGTHGTGNRMGKGLFFF